MTKRLIQRLWMMVGSVSFFFAIMFYFTGNYIEAISTLAIVIVAAYLSMGVRQ